MRRHLLAVLLWVAMVPALSLIFTAAVERTGGARDEANRDRQAIAQRIELTRAAERDAKAVADADEAAARAECSRAQACVCALSIAACWNRETNSVATANGTLALSALPASTSTTSEWLPSSADSSNTLTARAISIATPSCSLPPAQYLAPGVRNSDEPTFARGSRHPIIDGAIFSLKSVDLELGYTDQSQLQLYRGYPGGARNAGAGHRCYCFIAFAGGCVCTDAEALCASHRQSGLQR